MQSDMLRHLYPPCLSLLGLTSATVLSRVLLCRFPAISVIHGFIHSFIYSLVRTSIHSFIRSLICSCSSLLSSYLPHQLTLTALIIDIQMCERSVYIKNLLKKKPRKQRMEEDLLYLLFSPPMFKIVNMSTTAAMCYYQLVLTSGKGNTRLPVHYHELVYHDSTPVITLLAMFTPKFFPNYTRKCLWPLW